MKFNFLNKSRMLTGIIAATVVISGSIGAIAYATNGIDTVQKNVLLSEKSTVAVDSQNTPDQTLNNVQGTIEYIKTTHIKTADNSFDFEKNFIEETWQDPKTFENRADFKIMGGDNKLTDFHSNYLTNDGKIITIQRDDNGAAVSGTIAQNPKFVADKNLSHLQRSSFASIKENFLKQDWTKQDWKEEGIENTADGKTLKKLSKTYKTASPENIQVDTKLVAYLDETSGFPVKEELYQDVNGSMKMIWYDTYEYKYVNNDGKLFDTTGVELKDQVF